MNDVILAKRDAKWQADLSRRIQVERSKSYYYNNQEPYLKAIIKVNYPNSDEDMYPFLDYLNLTETVTNQLSVLFENPPKIELAKATKLITSNFVTLLQEAKIIPVLQKINKYVNLTKKVAVMPHYDDGKVTLEIITAEKIFVEQDPIIPTKAIAVWVQIGILTDTPKKAEKVGLYSKWTNTTQQTIEVNPLNGRIIKERPEKPNPYGRIPIVWFTNDIEEDSFWFDSENYIVEKNEIFNQDLSAFRFGCTLQSFSTLVLEGFDGKGDMKMGVHRPIRIPKNTSDDTTGKAYYISPDTDLEALYGVIDKKIIHVVNSMGLSAQSYRSDSASFSSGYQLKLSKLDVIKKNVADRIYYTESIKDLVSVMMQCYTLFSPKKKFPDNLDIKIDYAEMKFDEDPMQKETIDAMRLASGLTSIIRILMERNPDLSPEDAKKLAKEIELENGEFATGDKLKDFGKSEDK